MHPPRRLLVGLALLLPTGVAWAVQPKQPASDLDQKEFFRPELTISSSNVPLQDIASRSCPTARPGRPSSPGRPRGQPAGRLHRPALGQPPPTSSASSRSSPATAPGTT